MNGNEPIEVAIPCKTAIASENEPARKKTQLKQTRWKQITARTASRTTGGTEVDSQNASRRAIVIRETASITP